MKTMKTMKTMLLVFAMVLMAAPAMAGEDLSCNSDADCPDGYGCMMMGCACTDCPPGEECLPCDCPEEGEGWCEYFGDDDWDDDWGFYGSECDVDADCPMGFACDMVSVPCATNQICTPCVCEGCDPDDEDCEAEPCECPDCPEPEPCDPEEMGLCVYDMIDCETNSDCGEGFECIEVEECWGSSGGSTGDCACVCVCGDCADGEECPPCECPPCECEDDDVTEFDEGCDAVGSFCAPKEQPCEDDDECLDGWECMSIALNAGDPDCACLGCACPPCKEGEECEPCDCPPCECEDDPQEEWIEEEGYCVPDGWTEIIEDAGGVNGAGSYEEARDAMAGELYGDSDGTGAGSLQLSSPEAQGGTGNGATEDEASGCATGQAAGAAPMMILLFALVALAILPRRRSVTSR